MKTVFLMRHGKSSWDQLGITDFERPLLEKGIEATRKVVEHLKQKNVTIKHIASSPANRAINTALVVAESFGIKKKEILVVDNLYRADISDFEECIFALPDEWDHVLITSHNPGITNFANKFIENLMENIPTSGTVSISFNTDSWPKLYSERPVVNFVIEPKKIGIN